MTYLRRLPLAPIEALVVCLAMTACSGTSGTGADTDADAAVIQLPACGEWGVPEEQGDLKHPALTELSGLAESVLLPGVLWGHADSGDSARLLAVRQDGSLRAIVPLVGAKAVDWEDLALGPCAAGADPASWHCLYVGDLGDNDLKRKKGTIFRVVEPAALPDEASVATVPIAAPEWRQWVFTWPHGPRDIEALAVLPDGQAVAVSKDKKGGLAEIYRIALGAGSAANASRLGVIDTALDDVPDGLGLAVTGADLSADGTRLLVRTYLKVFVFDVGGALMLPPAQTGVALAAAPRRIAPSGLDVQGEAVAWSRAGGFWHGSEAFGSFVGRLWRVRCQ